MNTLSSEKQHLKRAIRLLGGQQMLAQRLNITQQAVSLWVRRSLIPVSHAVLVEALTERKVTKEQLRPDVFIAWRLGEQCENQKRKTRR